MTPDINTIFFDVGNTLRIVLKEQEFIDRAEAGLMELCQHYGWPLTVYSAGALAQAEGEFTPSAFVASVTGVDNVCERAAVLGGGRLIVPKRAKNGVTVAVARRLDI